MLTQDGGNKKQEAGLQYLITSPSELLSSDVSNLVITSFTFLTRGTGSGGEITKGAGDHKAIQVKLIIYHIDTLRCLG